MNNMAAKCPAKAAAPFRGEAADSCEVVFFELELSFDFWVTAWLFVFEISDTEVVELGKSV